MHEFQAIYEHGILRPLVPTQLAEGQVVTVVVPSAAATTGQGQQGSHEQRPFDWTVLRGAAPGLTGMDAQDWIDQERLQWDRRTTPTHDVP